MYNIQLKVVYSNLATTFILCIYIYSYIDVVIYTYIYIYIYTLVKVKASRLATPTRDGTSRKDKAYDK